MGTPGAATQRMTPEKRWTMVAVILGSGIVFLDSTVVNLALKRIGEELPSRIFGVLEGQSYVFTGYLISLSALLIIGGAMNDYFGRRRMFAIGLVGFTGTSLLCGLAPNLEFLVVVRILQGATGALLVPGSLSIITASFQGEEQGRAFGIWAGASAATVILGPFVGGLLVNSISWRVAFLINVPLLIVAYYATIRYVSESRDEEATGRFDWVGSTLIALAVGGLAFGTIRGQQTQWRGAAPFIALGIGGLAAVAFPILMARSSNPLVPLYLFRSRNFTVTNISTFVIYAALYVTFTFMAIFLVGTLGYNEPAAGIAGLPSTIWLALFSTRFGKLAARYGPRIFMALGPAVMGVAFLLLARVPADSEPWVFGTAAPRSILPPASYFIDFLPGFVLFGIGLMIMVAPLTTALMTSVSPQHSGLASAINNAISRVGSPLVGALIFVAVSASFYNAISERVPGTNVSSPEFRQQVAPLNPPAETVQPEVRAAAREASTDAFHLAMLVSAGLMFAGAAANLAIRNPSKQEVEQELAQVRPPDEQPTLAAPSPPIPETAAGAGNPRPEREQSS